jgi:hypothetical protein
MLKIGETYLDTWGVPHTICGYVAFGRDRDTSKVWSQRGLHYNLDGSPVRGGHSLVLDMETTPDEAIAFWKTQVSYILAHNCRANIKLVREEIRTMIARIRLHEGRKKGMVNG